MNTEIDQQKLFNYLKSYFESYSSDKSKTKPLLERIRFHIFDSTYTTSTGVLCKGITNKRQAEAFFNLLIRLLRKAEATTVCAMGEALFSKPKEEAIRLVRMPLNKIKVKESLSKIGGDPLNEWETWLKEHCEILAHQQADRIDNLKLPLLEAHLTQRQFALLHYYDGHVITKLKAMQIAKERGWSKKFWNKVEEVCSDETRRISRDLKKDVEAILPYLTTDAGKVKAKREQALRS